MVARKQVVGHVGGGTHRIERPEHHTALDVVGLEHVATHHHERTTVGQSQTPDLVDGLYTRLGEPGLGLPLQEVPGHAELPIRCVDESDHVSDSTEGV